MAKADYLEKMRVETLSCRRERGKEPRRGNTFSGSCRTAMAYDDSKKKEECLEGDRSIDDVGLAAGRTQREKKRSYKDLLREEEEIAAQVRKTSKKRLKDNDLFFLGTESHKKKRKHSSDEFFYGATVAKKSSKKSGRDEQGSFLLGHELQSFLKSARKKHKPLPDSHPLPVPEEFGPDTSLFSEGHGSEYDLSSMEPPLESGSSSGGELEAGELVIDDSYREIKKKKKSKKSKKKKDKEKHKEKKHSKSKKSSGLSASVAVAEVMVTPPPLPPPSTPFVLPVPPPPPPVFHTDGQSEKKKKKEEKEKEKAEKAEKDKEKPKKKNMSAYQVFCKEYRVTIVAEHPGIDFGELSKKLAEVWKQLPEKDKLVWKQKAQYLQHKQNKAEATTVKRKASSSEGAPKVKASPAGMLSPHKKSPSSTVVLSSSPAKAPDTDPIDVAAHLQLLGESLSLIGHRLQETEGMVAVSGSLSVLLDSIICALGPLACLTTQLPELNGCPKQVLSNTLDNIAYIMPGL
nr:HMG domain-containing protein 4 [Chelonoidis abingdonii]